MTTANNTPAETTSTDTTSHDSIVLERVVAGNVTVTVVTPTGSETLDVPAAIAGDDNLLRSVLAESGVSSAANAKIERGEEGAITLTKQADHNG